jgi:uncharacterized protein
VGKRPFVVGVTDLVHRLGSRRPVTRAATFDDLAISTARVEPGEEVTVDLELESISNGIVVEGVLAVPWTGACRRCLEPVHGIADTEVREIYERDPVEGETYPLTGDTLDLEPMVRDTVLLTLPLAPLCEERCLGPDPEAFPAVVDGGAAAEPDEPAGRDRGDPRWAALDQLKFD